VSGDVDGKAKEGGGLDARRPTTTPPAALLGDANPTF
jgi:hypothetical protein